MYTDIFPWLVKASYPLGWVLAVVALWRPRTPQGATAWVVALVTMPILAIPLFLVFGRSKFKGYSRGQEKVEAKLGRGTEAVAQVVSFRRTAPEGLEPLNRLAIDNIQPGFMKSDDLKILVDGERTYREILEAILSAREYVLFQFYIFKPDEAGTKFVEALKAKAKEGVRIYFLADKVGSSLGSKFMRELRDAGIEVAQFTSSKNWETKFQINFRNHRKVVVVDGRVAFVGGHNIGNEYLGKSSLGYWRDTHLRLSGECVSAAQVSFVKDWYWSAESLPKLNWKIDEGQEEGSTIVVSTGPADRGNLCLLSLLHLINGAKKRIWITTPYFVPPEAMSHALALAVLRGVDVRIILTKVTDNLILDRASTVYIEALLRAGIKFYRFRPGFMHQKVLLIDESGAIGSVNLDNRSIFINFEIMAISTEVKFVRELHEMLQNDLDLSEPVSLEEFAKKPVLRRLLARVVNLFAPVL